MIAGAVADDLTGALEVGALAVAEGFRTSVLLDPSEVGDAEDQVVVVNAETRRPTPDRTARFEAAVARVAGAEPWVYVKLDSTLRGAVADHLALVARRFAGRPVVFVPAHPAQGRTVVDGVLRVDGRALTETPFAADVHEPARSSSILDLFDGVIPAFRVPSAEALSRRFAVDSLAVGGRFAGDSLALGGRFAGDSLAYVLVCDGGSEEDLERIASAVRASGAVLAGSGGFAERWVRLLPGTRHPPPPFPVVTRPLVVCGSRHPSSLAQAAAAERASIPVVRASSSGTVTHDPGDLLVDLVARATTAVRAHRPDVLVVFGGETAGATLRALGCDRLTPIGEALPGVPVSRWNDAELTVVTKAGGFGPPGDIVGDILRRLGTRDEQDD